MQKLIDELTALEAKATPGKWSFKKGNFSYDDANLIVAMRNALPELLHKYKNDTRKLQELANQRTYERDAALSRAEKAEKAYKNVVIMFEKTEEAVCHRYIKRAEGAAAELEQVKSERDVLANTIETMVKMLYYAGKEWVNAYKGMDKNSILLMAKECANSESSEV